MKSKRWRIWRLFLLAVVAVLGIAIISFAIWWRTYPASQIARDALRSEPKVTVTETDEEIAFLPSVPAKVGLIFYPGARVDPAAYALFMHTLAQRGYATFILKMPLNFALLGEDRAAQVIAGHPSITSWIVGGHSLGGVAASRFAARSPAVRGLLLYASYPDGDLSHTALRVVSIYGTHDNLATPMKVNAAKHLLPATTKYVPIEGGIHGFFGEYGVQDGDGQPTISREAAREQIVSATLALLDTVGTS